MNTSTHQAEVSIALPLPIDVVRTLIGLIGAAYPGARVDSGSPFAMTLTIPGEDRVSAREDWDAIAAEAKVLAEAIELNLAALGNGGASFSGPEWLSGILVTVGEQMLQAHDAENCVEWQVLRDGSPPLVLSVARSAEQTPLALRRAAETRAAAYAEKLRELGHDPNEIHP